jgi:hypothetical protein
MRIALGVGSVAAILIAGVFSAAGGDNFYLLTGVDVQKYPGSARYLPGGPPVFPVYDGDRLAGTADVGPTVVYNGEPGNLYQPNHLGSLSFLWRRGTVPGGLPFLGIEFLGGPLLDLDGNLGNGSRSLIPPDPDVELVTPVEIPGSDSFAQFVTDRVAGTIQFIDADITGTNESAAGQRPGISTILVTIAGTQPDGAKLPGPNPTLDTRIGTLTPFTGTGGSLIGVYRIDDLGYELWEDPVDPYSGNRAVLGGMQFLGKFRGWLLIRNPVTGAFDALTGQGLGSTVWPAVDANSVGRVVNTANGLAGGSATIRIGHTGQDFTLAGNGGLVLTDYSGDIGAYFDNVVIPLLAPHEDRVIYLEAAGFGVNNSGDPVFIDTIGYDATIIAAASVCGLQRGGDLDCDGDVDFFDIDPLVAALGGEAAWQATNPNPGCSYLCVADLDANGIVDFFDIDPFVAALSQP